MESRKFIHYNHNPYGDKLNSPPYSLVDGEEYLMEFGEWEGMGTARNIGIARKVRGFKISGIFMVNPEWTIINNEGVGVHIPGVKSHHSIWFNDTKDISEYDILINDINKSFMDWVKIK